METRHDLAEDVLAAYRYFILNDNMQSALVASKEPNHSTAVFKNGNYRFDITTLAKRFEHYQHSLKCRRKPYGKPEYDSVGRFLEFKVDDDRNHGANVAAFLKLLTKDLDLTTFTICQLVDFLFSWYLAPDSFDSFFDKVWGKVTKLTLASKVSSVTMFLNYIRSHFILVLDEDHKSILSNISERLVCLTKQFAKEGKSDIQERKRTGDLPAISRAEIQAYERSSSRKKLLKDIKSCDWDSKVTEDQLADITSQLCLTLQLEHGLRIKVLRYIQIRHVDEAIHMPDSGLFFVKIWYIDIVFKTRKEWILILSPEEMEVFRRLASKRRTLQGANDDDFLFVADCNNKHLTHYKLMDITTKGWQAVGMDSLVTVNYFRRGVVTMSQMAHNNTEVCSVLRFSWWCHGVLFVLDTVSIYSYIGSVVQINSYILRTVAWFNFFVYTSTVHSNIRHVYLTLPAGCSGRGCPTTAFNTHRDWYLCM